MSYSDQVKEKLTHAWAHKDTQGERDGQTDGKTDMVLMPLSFLELNCIIMHTTAVFTTCNTERLRAGAVLVKPTQTLFNQK